MPDPVCTTSHERVSDEQQTTGYENRCGGRDRTHHDHHVESGAAGVAAAEPTGVTAEPAEVTGVTAEPAGFTAAHPAGWKIYVPPGPIVRRTPDPLVALLLGSAYRVAPVRHRSAGPPSDADQPHSPVDKPDSAD